MSTPNKNVFSPNLENPIIIEHLREFYPQELRDILNKYFEEVSMYGKHIINEGAILSESRFRSSNRYAITVILAKNNFVRNVAKYIPYSIRRIFSGNPLSLKKSDISISKENIEKSYSLIVIAKK